MIEGVQDRFARVRMLPPPPVSVFAETTLKMPLAFAAVQQILSAFARGVRVNGLAVIHASA